ncbi:MAG: kelch repeat-containing protein [Bacteroidota bacterium]
MIKSSVFQIARSKTKLLLIALEILIFTTSCGTSNNTNWSWEVIEAKGIPTARHEAGLVAYDNRIYLIGGRRINPTDVFDTKTNTWTTKSPPPIEVHHFQPVVVENAIYLVGAMTGEWPNEKPLDRVLIYYPDQDKYEFKHQIPEERRIGGAGTVFYNDKIYLIGGITNGHMNGSKSWFDSYDPKTGEWKVLPNAPDARDHFQAAITNDKLFAFAGRRSSHKTGQDLELTNPYGNIFDFQTRKWIPVTQDLSIPTQRAGNSIEVWGDEIIIGGGESSFQESRTIK